jgi:hypothetical protein
MRISILKYKEQSQDKPLEDLKHVKILHQAKEHYMFAQRSSLRAAFGSDIISIIIFSGESSQFANVFRSIYKIA